MVSAQEKHAYPGDTNKSVLALPHHCMTTCLCVSRYLNGVGRNGAAPVLLELANEVMLLL